jgi:23S rRNA pseudouridine1911/1915/1917 synthase
MKAGRVSLTVERADARQRLDRFLAGLGSWGTRSQVHRLIAEGQVRIDGHLAKPGTVLRAGQRIVVEPSSRPTHGDVQPQAIPLDVLYEDDWLLVINKPAGLVVHPAPGNWQGTVVNALLHRWRNRAGDLDPLRPGIVHRLDKDTSGVLVIAKDAATLAELGRQFRSREVSKEYLALVWGKFGVPRGEVRRPIGRHPVHRTRMSVRAGGRVAVTRYQVIAEAAGMSLLRVSPETGRTHQIRVHMAAAGHPVVGDPVYGGRPAKAAELGLHRQALHATSLAFRHPRTSEPLRISAPLPADLVAALSHCGGFGLTSAGASSSVLAQSASSSSGFRRQSRLGSSRSPRHASSS